MVSQGYDGNITHKGEWSKALDFIIVDNEMKTYEQFGVVPENFYCYGKPVLAPADGVVQFIEDFVEDNEIGRINQEKNWGNSIVIKHTEGLYTKMSHLKKNSFRVKPGDYVRQGDIIAACGNSGRSPEPHLHFQVQTTPHIGSKTFAYPFAYFITSTHGNATICEFSTPTETCMVSNVIADPSLRAAFEFLPGFNMQVKANGLPDEHWEVFTDAFNQSYIYCHITKSMAFFKKNEAVFYFTGFEGNRNSLLYHFYLAAYKIYLANTAGVAAKDTFPLQLGKNNLFKWIQDMLAPFYIFSRLQYESLNTIVSADFLNPGVMIESKQVRQFMSVRSQINHFTIEIKNNQIRSFSFIKNNQEIKSLMYTKRILIALLVCLFFIQANAQEVAAMAAADTKSLALYNAGQWKELMKFGKAEIAKGVDFPILRMRTGYAAFMIGNYSQSLLQYKKVLDTDANNAVALYYVYLNNLYLNNITQARYYAAKLPDETKESALIKKTKVSGVETEFSYKMPTDTTRKNGSYLRAGLNLQLGYRLELQQSVASYNQDLNEPRLLLVVNNRKIRLRQKEYYGKLIFAATGNITVLGGYHYLNTPFNNVVYNNSIGFAGIQYKTPYVHLKAMASFGKVTDTTYTQYDGTVTVYPLGNTKLYNITRAAYGDNFTLSNILGYGITKKLWLEGNITVGKFTSLLENDGLYVFNDIDQKQIKAGGSMYALLGKNLTLTLNYTFEHKLRYKTNNFYFYQHSINGGLSWKF
jgi:hypothetical protein